MKRLLSLMLVIALLLCVPAPFVFAASLPVEMPAYTIEEAAGYLTREEGIAHLVDTLGEDYFRGSVMNISGYADYAEIAPEYRASMAVALSGGLITGYDDNTLRPKAVLARVEAFVMLSRALGSIELVPLYDTVFSDVPDWAKADIDRLASAGILLGYGDGTFGSEDPITPEQMELLLNRIKEQPTPQSDFYAFINNEWSVYTQIPDGYPEWSDTYQLTQDIAYRMQDIILALVNAYYFQGVNYEKGSNAQKIMDVYLTAADMDYRDQVGIKPIQPLLDSIDKIKSISDLMTVAAQLESYGFHNLLPLKVETDFKKSSRYCLAFEGCYTGIDPEMIQSGEYQYVLDAYEAYIRSLFMLSGQPEQEAAQGAKQVRSFCVQLGAVSLSSSAWDNIEQLYNPYTRRDFQRLFTNIDTYAYLEDMGFSETRTILIMDEELAKSINKFLHEENLLMLKNYLRASLLDQSAFYLTSAFYDAQEDFHNAVNGTTSNIDPAGYAVSITQSLLGLELGEFYVNSFFSESTRTYVEEMAQAIIETYQRRIENLDWMSETAKRIAVNKLQNIRIKIGYPDYINGYVNDAFQVRSSAEGGNLMENMMNYNLLKSQQNQYLIQNKVPVNKDEWLMLPQTVNAYYDTTTNSIVLPAGILQPPFYNPNASYEANLGGVGRIIAHEITHAFDNVGSQFDQDGNLEDWWSAEDFQAFDEACQAFVDAYNQIEVQPGFYVDGARTLSENIADMGAMACILDLAGADNPNLGDLFESYAISWRSKSTDAYAQMKLATDDHAPDKVRTNFVLSNFKAFLDYYGIEEGDPMYRAPEDRLSLW